MSVEEQKIVKDRVEALGAKLSPAAFANTFLTKSKAPKINAAAIRKAVKVEIDNEITDKALTDDEIVSISPPHRPQSF